MADLEFANPAVLDDEEVAPVPVADEPSGAAVDTVRTYGIKHLLLTPIYAAVYGAILCDVLFWVWVVVALEWKWKLRR